MINILLLLLIWAIIVAIYYGLAKSLTANLSEEVFIEVITTRLIRFRQFRKMKRIELFGYVSLFLVMPLVPNMNGVLGKIQDWLYHQEDSLFISHHGYVFVPLFLALGFWLLSNLFFARFGLTKGRKWTYRIEIWEAFALSRSAKIKGVITAFLLQFLFVFGMTNYTTIKDNMVFHCAFFQIQPTKTAFNEIQNVEVFMEIGESYVSPKFLIQLKNGKKINAIQHNYMEDVLMKQYKQLAVDLKEAGVEMKIDPLGILDKSNMRKKMSKEGYEKIIEFFTFLSMVEKGIHKKYAIGEVVEYENISYQVDSVVVDKDKYFKSYSDEKEYVIVYMSVGNERDTTVNFYKLLSLKIEDGEGKKHMESMVVAFLKEDNIFPELPSEIPSKEKISGGVVYQLPKNTKNLTLKYDLSYMNEEKLKFDLGR